VQSAALTQGSGTADDENDMLDLAFGLTETSRLGCQVRPGGICLRGPRTGTRNLPEPCVGRLHCIRLTPYRGCLQVILTEEMEGSIFIIPSATRNM